MAHSGAQSFAWLHRELRGKVVQQRPQAGPVLETCASLEAQAGLMVPIPEWGALHTKADGGPEHHQLMMSHPGDLCNRRRNRSVLCRLVMSLLLCSSRRWERGARASHPVVKAVSLLITGAGAHGHSGLCPPSPQEPTTDGVIGNMDGQCCSPHGLVLLLPHL